MSSVVNTLSAVFQRYIPLIEAEMRAVINAPAQPRPFNVMLNYHLGFTDSAGAPASAPAGKRIRPVLTLLCCEACSGDYRPAIPAAAGVELLHNFSLIHDDIEDRDELRRGRPTVWKLWGEAQAINAGDAMFAFAHLALLRSAERGASAERVVRAMRAFDAMCIRLTIGQHLDLSFESRSDVTAEEYLRMIESKTAALTSSACEIGALLGGADDATVQAFADFGHWLGVSFQLQDDVLGIWGDPAITGKHDSDLAHGKKTLPVLYAAERDARIRQGYLEAGALSNDAVRTIREMIEAAGGRAHAEQAAEEAYAHALAALDTTGLDNAASHALRELARSLLGRTN
ncbi:MAG: polyprenyl synthetase family protein [Chloroflexi bacterium]|jgi:geranylgeranyl diphosphate synthase type I|uniref:Polyprenyl synthetase n=1 Tax=Candidatus Thermofonsia Clade 3 bacterium TaxID=2364212 RepID=A0A2M8QFY3_9CHLR|nr:polyprenyl synthetase family protein [Candidatus Roseilinea sp. NK_OTU-006]PJF48720.1 MAG: polyprenyl synthetase [Candidatus Thermofonsia Clade 3 bacterium]RMG62899.1 MAG: polyprenyl synthetase family protein [Chloroflexota bacterium]